MLKRTATLALGAFALVASFENLLLLVIILLIFWHFRNTAQLVRRVFFVRFGLIYSVLLILMLSLVYYNVGLGLRQKVMFLPGLLTLFVTLLAVKRAKAAQPALRYA